MVHSLVLRESGDSNKMMHIYSVEEIKSKVKYLVAYNSWTIFMVYLALNGTFY